MRLLQANMSKNTTKKMKKIKVLASQALRKLHRANWYLSVLLGCPSARPPSTYVLTRQSDSFHTSRIQAPMNPTATACQMRFLTQTIDHMFRRPTKFSLISVVPISKPLTNCLTHAYKCSLINHGNCVALFKLRLRLLLLLLLFIFFLSFKLQCPSLSIFSKHQ